MSRRGNRNGGAVGWAQRNNGGNRHPQLGNWDMPSWGWHRGGGNGGVSGAAGQVASGITGQQPHPGGQSNQKSASDLMQQWLNQQQQAALDGQKQSAFSYMQDLLNQYGLGTLTGKLQQLIQSGVTDTASLQLELENTDEWKRRFAGNEMLRQKGLDVLSVGEYLSAEKSYAQVLKQYGVPDGFYSSTSEFANFIGNNVSPSELNQRMQEWSDLANREDPAIKDQLQAMGLSKGDLLAYFIDPSKAAPLIQQKYQSVLIGGAARRAGITTSNTEAQHLAEMGVTEQQASQGFGVVAQDLAPLQKLAQIYGTDYTQSDLESEVFDNNAQAANKRKKLASQERAAFSGQSGIGNGSLTQNTAGLF